MGEYCDFTGMQIAIFKIKLHVCSSTQHLNLRLLCCENNLSKDFQHFCTAGVNGWNEETPDLGDNRWDGLERTLP